MIIIYFLGNRQEDDIMRFNDHID